MARRAGREPAAARPRSLLAGAARAGLSGYPSRGAGIKPGADLPADRLGAFKRAQRLSWLSIVYLISAVVPLALVLGSSEALKTAWFDDVLSLFPPFLFLAGSRVAARRPNVEYP
jgi:hypothetical protein